MRLVVGLGNPGSEYTGTRHNVGFEAIEELADRYCISVKKRAHRAVLGDGTISGQRVILARPMTFMNLSGEAVASICRMYKILPPEVIVIVDDIALPIGKLRLRLKGSAGGHNGLTSVERHLYTQEYPRIRIGVGSAMPGRMVDHVLGKFKPQEREAVADAIERAADAVEMALAEGFEKAMNRYNQDLPSAREEGS
jgi:peptidyl-tRNA hydrolase, PTH1 family